MAKHLVKDSTGVYNLKHVVAVQPTGGSRDHRKESYKPAAALHMAGGNVAITDTDYDTVSAAYAEIHGDTPAPVAPSASQA